MTENKITLKSESKPAQSDRFAPAEKEVTASGSLDVHSAEGLNKHTSRFDIGSYDLEHDYTEADFADSLTTTHRANYL